MCRKHLAHLSILLNATYWFTLHNNGYVLYVLILQPPSIWTLTFVPSGQLLFLGSGFWLAPVLSSVSVTLSIDFKTWDMTLKFSTPDNICLKKENNTNWNLCQPWINHLYVSIIMGCYITHNTKGSTRVVPK